MDSPEQEKAELCDEQWMRAHGGEGSITLDEVPELKSGVERVHHLMKDGEWHTAEEVRIAAGTDGVPASEGLRRLRDLRSRYGLSVEKRRLKDSRFFEYRVVTAG